VSEETGRSLVDVYGIATFYGPSAWSRGAGTWSVRASAPPVTSGVHREWLRNSNVSSASGPERRPPTGSFTLETVNCLGACALGPVVVIDGHCFSKVGRGKVRQLLDDASAGLGPATPAKAPSPSTSVVPGAITA